MFSGGGDADDDVRCCDDDGTGGDGEVAKVMFVVKLVEKNMMIL